jgi:hypothetical protein
MNLILLTVLTLSAPGVDGAPGYGGGAYGSGAYGSGGYGAGGMNGYDECEMCEEGGHRHGRNRGERERCWGPMPQTCYMPSFGCYASTRFMHRYPAFHGTYYRKAYNYRNYFDYPWHAGLHEPTSHFSYHVPAETAADAVPTPTPATSMRQIDSTYQAALIPAPVVESQPVAGTPLRTLRR